MIIKAKGHTYDIGKLASGKYYVRRDSSKNTLPNKFFGSIKEIERNYPNLRGKLKNLDERLQQQGGFFAGKDFASYFP